MLRRLLYPDGMNYCLAFTVRHRPSFELVKKKKINLSLRGTQKIMGAKPPENADFTLHLKGKAVSLSDPAFPNVSRILHLFDIQGWVTSAAQKKFLVLVNCPLKLVGKRMIIPDETVRGPELHNRLVFKAFKASGALSNGPTTLPSAMSRSASASFACHSQYTTRKSVWSPR
jgi:hypothetical protein